MPHGAIPFPFGQCKICNDKATGLHYGVNTCEGCKGFFKRSLAKAEKYKCFFGGNCEISPQNRNRCKACRFQRCLDNGMAMEAVKMGRIPKAEKEKALATVEQGNNVKEERTVSTYNQDSQSNQHSDETQSTGLTSPMDSVVGTASKLEKQEWSYEWPNTSRWPQDGEQPSDCRFHNEKEIRGGWCNDASSSRSKYAECFNPPYTHGMNEAITNPTSGIEKMVEDIQPAELNKDFMKTTGSNGHTRNSGYFLESASNSSNHTPLLSRCNSSNESPIISHIPGFDNWTTENILYSKESLHSEIRKQVDAEVCATIMMPDIKSQLQATSIKSPETDSYEKPLLIYVIPLLIEAADKLRLSLQPILNTVMYFADNPEKHHELNKLKKANYDQVKQIWFALFHNIPESNKQVLSLLKSIPGFLNSLNDITDRATQMEAMYLPIWAIVTSNFFIKGEFYCPIGRAGNVNVPFYSIWWMCHFLPQDFVQNMIKFARHLQSLRLTKVEFVTICSICATDSGHDMALSNDLGLNELHVFYWALLEHLLSETKANPEACFEAIRDLLNDLKSLCKRQISWIQSFSMDSPPTYCCKFLQVSKNPSVEEIEFFKKSNFDINTFVPVHDVMDLLGWK